MVIQFTAQNQNISIDLNNFTGSKTIKKCSFHKMVTLTTNTGPTSFENKDVENSFVKIITCIKNYRISTTPKSPLGGVYLLVILWI